MRPLLAFLLAFGVPLSGWADGPLRSTVIFGNEKTSRQTILEIINVPSETYVNDQLLVDVEGRLAHAGLFKLIKVKGMDNLDGTTDLRITLAEKQLWFAVPIFQAWSGSYSGGAGFVESNCFFPGTTTIIAGQGGNKLNRGYLAIDAKNLWDSDFAVKSSVLLRSDAVPLYNGKETVGEIKMKDVGFSVIPGYQWTNEIRTAFGVNYTRVWYGDSPLVTDLRRKGDDVSLQAQFSYDGLVRREAFLQGIKFETAYQFAELRLGSDFSYHIEEVTYIQALTLLKYFNYVINVEGKIGDSKDAFLPFHRQFTMGGSTLRGFQDREFRGDTRILARQDLLVRLFKQKHFSVFGSTFYDVGFIYHDDDGPGRKSVRNGVGAGLKVSLPDVIAPVFGMDAGYGIEDHGFHLYFALGLVQ